MEGLIEFGAVIASSLVICGAGLLVMMVSEWTLWRFAERHGFFLERGGFNWLRAWKPHVLRGAYRGWHVTITYTVADYFAEGGGGTPSRVMLSLPGKPPLTFRIAPSWPFCKRRMRTGDARFDRWVSLEGSPRRLVLELLRDSGLRRQLKAIISPTIFFTSRITLTRSGQLTLPHRSLLLTHRMIRRDLEVLSLLAERVSLLSTDENVAERPAAQVESAASAIRHPG